MQDKFINNEAKYLQFLESSNFNPSFVKLAKNAIDWIKHPDGVVVENAFKDIVLPENFKLPNSIYKISEFAFQNTTLPFNFIIPCTTRIIEENAFDNASFKNQNDDNSLCEIDFYTYKTIGAQSRDLNEFKWSYKKPNPPITIEGWKIIPSMCFKFEILDENFEIPNSVIEIGHEAFAYTKLPEKFYVPHSVKKLGHGVFENSTIPENFEFRCHILKLPPLTFKSAKFLGSFEVPKSVVEIEFFAFRAADLSNGLKLPKHLNYIGEKSFWEAKLPQNFSLPIYIKEIGDDAFTGAITHGELTIPSDAKYSGFVGFEPHGDVYVIKEGQFDFLTLPIWFKIPKKVTIIENHAFSFARLPRGFMLPSTVLMVREFAFINAKINGENISASNPLCWENHPNITNEF